jgi:hypothetical protein
MRRVHGIATAMVLVGVTVLGHSAGCIINEPIDCETALVGCPTTGSASSSTGTGGGTPQGCDPSKNAKPVADTCGVFVSPTGDDGAAGTKAKPLKTIKAALAKGATIYACAGTMPYAEAVTIGKPATLFGALDCASWGYDASKKSQLTANADAVPLTIGSKGDGAEINDFAITAASATKDGGSSIAVLVNAAMVSFVRCDLVAGDAQDGVAGMSGGTQATQAAPGLPGDSAGTTGTQNGGNGGLNAVCSLSGGKGGGGGVIQNGSGGDGAPGDGGNGGAGGIGDTGSGCSTTANGSNGTAGPFGSGASGIGTLDASGYHGSDGQAGTDGPNGKSGGGGGGSKASTTVHGAGGGGGGAGGCGGKHGEAGKGGGSTIALVSVGATVTMTSCTLKAGKGASGGAGGDGQFGQQGGAVGPGGMGGTVADACNGGKGGKGGDGGPGGGGLGGHSLGIAAAGTAPVLDAATKSAITPGAKGIGGKGGNMDASMNHGTDGMAAPCWDFGSNAACK